MDETLELAAGGCVVSLARAASWARRWTVSKLRSDSRILSSADTDFGELLANAPALAPSVILLRRAGKRAGSLAAVVIADPGQVTEDLAAGALIVIRHSHPSTMTPHETIRLSAAAETSRATRPHFAHAAGRYSALHSHAE